MKRSSIMLLFLVLLLAFVLGLALNGQRHSVHYQIAMENLELETAARMGALKVIFWSGLAVVVLLSLVAFTVGLVRALWLRSQLIRPNDHGLFPVVKERASGQILRPGSGYTYYHDPNRQVTGAVVYEAGSEGVEAHHLLPPDAQDGQLQVTSQAQAVQLVAAASQRATSPATQRLVRGLVSRPLRSAPRMPEIRVLSPQIPEERHLLAALRHDWEGDDTNASPIAHAETL